MQRLRLNWARSRRVGRRSELAVLAPIIPGRVPGERRTHEERLRSVLASLAGKAEAGIPTPLGAIPSLHLGDVMIIRPEHYLTHSALEQDDAYYPLSGQQGGARPQDDSGYGNIPHTLDQYELFDPSAGPIANTPIDEKPWPQNPFKFRSWLLTIVIFDGDAAAYLREIAEFIERDFDEVFENCEGYPFARNFEEFWNWVRRYQIQPDVLYTPYPDLSVARIKELEDFKRRFDAFVAAVRSPTGQQAGHLDDLFDAFLRENQQRASGFPSPGGLFETKPSS